MCWALVAPGLAAPPRLLDLHQFMTTAPTAKIPTTRSAMQLISSHPIAAHFTMADGRLAEIVGHSICLTHTVGTPSEMDTVILEHSTVVQVRLVLPASVVWGPGRIPGRMMYASARSWFRSAAHLGPVT